MWKDDMGKVLVAAKMENIQDALDSMMQKLPADQVRTVEVTDALVDTGATGLLLPSRYIKQLGLIPVRTRKARGIGGLVDIQTYSAVRLTIQGRDCTVDVSEVGDELPVLIGQVPLELLDWVIDPRNQKLIGNPAHGGEHIMEVFEV
jgi:clan AA aspartic protease